jgi:hypothetical protein
LETDVNERVTLFPSEPGMTIRKTVILRKGRERLRPSSDGALRDRVTERGVLLDKVPASEADDPFMTFSEWSSEADEKAYCNL